MNPTRSAAKTALIGLILSIGSYPTGDPLGGFINGIIPAILAFLGLRTVLFSQRAQSWSGIQRFGIYLAFIIGTVALATLTTWIIIQTKPELAPYR
jgi:chromate transport protein ChrA